MKTERRTAWSVSAAMELTLGVLAAVTLFFMMWITFFDVVTRKLPIWAIPAADELTKLSLGVVVFTALPLATARGEHIVISLFDALYSRFWNAIRLSLVDLVSAGLLAVLAWRLAELAVRIGGYDDKTLFLGAPLSPFAWFMCGTATLSSVIALGLAAKRLRSLITAS